MDNTENRGTSPNGQSQRQHRYGGEAGTPEQHAEAMS